MAVADTEGRVTNLGGGENPVLATFFYEICMEENLDREGWKVRTWHPPPPDLPMQLEFSPGNFFFASAIASCE